LLSKASDYVINAFIKSLTPETPETPETNGDNIEVQSTAPTHQTPKYAATENIKTQEVNTSTLRHIGS
jgi:hypothetical protein